MVKDIYAPLRKKLVDELKNLGIKSEAVLTAVGKVRRDMFVSPAFVSQAYHNSALPIGENQTISQPLVVAKMTEALDVERNHKVLEIGTGSGYQTSILCAMVRRVFTIERFESLSKNAEKTLFNMHISNFTSKVGDGTLGWKEQAPFDRIIVTAASPQVPNSLLEQLNEGGKLVIPIGELGQEQQKLLCYTKTKNGFDEQLLGYVRFVPLVGEQGLKRNPRSA